MSNYTATITLNKKQWQRLLFSLGYAAGAMVRDQAISRHTTDAAAAVADQVRAQVKFSDIEDDEHGDD